MQNNYSGFGFNFRNITNFSFSMKFKFETIKKVFQPVAFNYSF